MFVMYVPYDVTFKPPHPPNKKAALTSTSTVTSSHEKIQKKKKKITEPLIDQVVPPTPTPLPQRLKLFFSLECGSKLFSQPLQRATTSPQSLGSAEGVEPGGRGAYVTQHTQEANQWGEKMHRGMTEKEDEDSASERCFQLGDKGPRIVRAMLSETEKQNAKW